MALSKADLITKRDAVLTEIGRLTVQPITEGVDGIRSDAEKKMTVLVKQWNMFNQAINTIDGPRQINLEGIDV